ncbi:MAG TPA: LLM class F420-dependent oxidoreductase [Acidimicrobiales bacterium]|jgi:probable F420-dependent oxidoreductase|nr:LLM class F420-dependent oxidoreductase [Acidimicrobiales bacterium]
MELGVVFPQIEMKGDRGAVRAYGQAASDLGFTHLAAYDHVLGADTAVHGDLGGPYDIDDPFHEPLTMFAYLAGFTDLAFATSILIGPQRQTALLAKQAAELDFLTGGKFRLGLGIGWNKVEYQALGYSFADRGAFLEEQVTVLRQLWTQKSVTFEGRFHHIEAAGLAPHPVQQPIPIWIGAFAPAALRRVGRLADGWFPMVKPGAAFDDAWAHIAEGAQETGRDLSALRFEGRVDYGDGDLDRMAGHAARWRDAGASHLSLNTMYSDLDGVDAHIAALAAAKPALG